MKSTEEHTQQETTSSKLQSEAIESYIDPVDQQVATIAESIPEQPVVDQILEKLDPIERKAMKTFMLKKERFSGPLPHPDHLKGYEECFPGAAKEIIEMAKGQMSHRQNMEKKHIELQEKSMDSHYKHIGKGTNYGFILALTFILSGVLLIVLDKAGSGFALISAVIIGLVGQFIFKQRSQESSSEEETESNEADEPDEPK